MMGPRENNGGRPAPLQVEGHARSRRPSPCPPSRRRAPPSSATRAPHSAPRAPVAAASLASPRPSAAGPPTFRERRSRIRNRRGVGRASGNAVCGLRCVVVASAGQRGVWSSCSDSRIAKQHQLGPSSRRTWPSSRTACSALRCRRLPTRPGRRSTVPAGHAEVELHRTPPVLRKQQELGRPTARQLRGHPEVPAHRTHLHPVRVRDHLVRKTYKTGAKDHRRPMRELRITPNDLMPKFNHAIEPVQRNGDLLLRRPLGGGLFFPARKLF